MVLSRQPKKMKSYSESHKSDKSGLIVNGKSLVASPPKEAPPPDSLGVFESQDTAQVRESPRSKAVMKRLATRERGSRTDSKKTSVKK